MLLRTPSPRATRAREPHGIAWQSAAKARRPGHEWEMHRARARRDALASVRRALPPGIARKAAEGQRGECSALAARRDSVQEMLRHRAYSTEAVKDVFDALEREPEAGFRPLGVLADFLEVDVGYEKVVEQFLAEELEHVVVGNWAEAGRGAQLVREEFAGRAAFLLVQREQDGVPESPADLESAARLTDHVRLVTRGSGAIPALLPKLRDGFLVEDHATAERLAGLHPDLYFVLADGTWYRGPVVQVGRKSSSGPLVLKQQLRDLAPLLQQAEQALAQAEQEIESAEDAVRRDSGELEVVMAGLQDAEKEALAVQHEVSQSERAIADLKQVARTADEEIERLGRSARAPSVAVSRHWAIALGSRANTPMRRLARPIWLNSPVPGRRSWWRCKRSGPPCAPRQPRWTSASGQASTRCSEQRRHCLKSVSERENCRARSSAGSTKAGSLMTATRH